MWYALRLVPENEPPGGSPVRRHCWTSLPLLLICTLSACSQEPTKPKVLKPKIGVPAADAAKIETVKTAQPAEGLPFYKLTFEEAQIKANAETKVVLIDFYTTWCVPCKHLDKVTWPHKDVLKWL